MQGQDDGAPFRGGSLGLGPAWEPFLQLIRPELGRGVPGCVGPVTRQGTKTGALGHLGPSQVVLPANWLCAPLLLCHGTPAPESRPTSAALTPHSSLPFVLF